MTTYRLMDGASGRPGTGSSQMTPPTSPASYAGPFQAGMIFAVTQGGMWFEGYWWYVTAGGDTGAQTFCLYPVKTLIPAAGTIISAATVTSGTLTAGAWNYIPLATPVQLSPGAIGSADGGLFAATTAWTAVHGFPDTANAFGAGDPYADGISNGPLVTYGQSTGCVGLPAGSTYGTATNDPTTAAPTGTDAGYDNFWLDVQVSDTAPPGYSGTYRLWPSRGDSNAASGADAAVDYVIATEVHLTEDCAVNGIWYYSPSGTAQLATRASVYSITGAGSGTETVSVTSPSWSGAAASGWVRTAVPGNPVLAAGAYKVAVYNSAGSPDEWSAKDAASDYWQSGEGASGITWGPLYAPPLSASSAAYNYDAGGSGNTPPYSDGTGPITHGQPTFAQTGPQYPYLYAPVGAGLDRTQNYWVDLEVTPVPSGSGALLATFP